ncbi:cytochrome P450, partial [Corynespora cassiicola Philippines]
YRRRIHPLSRYPGPFWYSVSTIPAGISLLRGRYAFENKRLHDKYGKSLIRVSPNELSFNTAQAFQDIYGFQQGRRNTRKSLIHTGAVQLGSNINTVQYTIDDAEHSRQRRALSHSFSTTALMEQEPIIQEYATKFIENMREMARKGTEFNICDWFSYFTFDLIGDLSFGESFGCLDHGTILHEIEVFWY